MSAGTSGILPSATYASADGANSAVGADPLWLSTNGGAVVGPTTMTGPVSLPNGIAVYPSVSGGVGVAQYMTIGLVRFFWSQQTTATDGSITLQVGASFATLGAVTAIPQNSENVLCEFNTTNAAAGTVRIVCVDSTAPHPPAGAGIPVQIFGVVLLTPPA